MTTYWEDLLEVMADVSIRLFGLFLLILSVLFVLFFVILAISTFLFLTPVWLACAIYVAVNRERRRSRI